jgi:hypothetical protein
MSEKECMDIVKSILPDKNFFAFKLFPKDEKEKNDYEMEELQRLNKMAIEHGNYRNCNSDYAYLLPIILSNDCRE